MIYPDVYLTHVKRAPKGSKLNTAKGIRHSLSALAKSDAPQDALNDQAYTA